MGARHGKLTFENIGLAMVAVGAAGFYFALALWTRKSGPPTYVVTVTILFYGLVTQFLLNRFRRSEKRLRSVFENSGAGALIVGADMTITQANSQFESITGYPREEVEGRTSWLTFVHPKDQEKVRRTLNLDDAAASGPRTCDCAFLDREGHTKSILLTFSTMPGARDRLISLSDISDLKAAEEELQHRALYDSLTDLPNRALLIDHLTMAIKRHRRHPAYRFTLLYLDIDRFRNVNESLGYHTGDRLLQSFAQRLKRCLRDFDTLCRIGNDEFAILLEDIDVSASALAIADRVHELLYEPFHMGDHEIFVRVSIGVVLNAETYEWPENIIRDADAAMYHAKKEGKARYEIFDRRLHERALQNLQLEMDLRRALTRNEFELYYQPIVSVENGVLIGFEALVRWRHPERGVIYPDSFIPLAEETGIIIPLGRWVLNEACRQMVEWQMEDPSAPRLFVSVNISVKQFTQEALIREVETALIETGFPPELLKLEITETMLVTDAGPALEALLRLKKLGIQIVIDDFGTGYSSLSYLQQLPVDTLKVDRRFVMPIQRTATPDREIVEAIISLAHRLGMNVIAEGVETVDQQTVLSGLNCQFAQGFLFARPLNKVDAGAFIRKGQRERASKEERRSGTR